MLLERLLAWVARHLLELHHDLVEVVACRIRPVGLELREPQRLADGQQVPVIYVCSWVIRDAKRPRFDAVKPLMSHRTVTM